LTGSSSIYHSLRCAVAVAETLAKDRPDWELAAGRLGHAVAHHPNAFAPRSSSRWTGITRCSRVRSKANRVAGAWPRAGRISSWRSWRALRVDQQLGDGAETAECVMALDALGMESHALELFVAGQNLRLPDGSYWTGDGLSRRGHLPDQERTTYTFAAMVLAADALSSATPAAGLFRGECLPAALDLAEPHCTGDAAKECTAG